MGSDIGLCYEIPIYGHICVFMYAALLCNSMGGCTWKQGLLYDRLLLLYDHLWLLYDRLWLLYNHLWLLHDHMMCHMVSSYFHETVVRSPPHAHRCLHVAHICVYELRIAGCISVVTKALPAPGLKVMVSFFGTKGEDQ